MSHKSILADDPAIRAAQEEYGYADAVVAGGTVYVSGVVAYLNEDEEDMAPAFARVFERLGRTLDRLNLGWENVVAIDTFHTDLGGQSATFKQVKNRYIKAPFPAWTAVGVTELARPRSLAEIKLTAWKDNEA